MDEQSVARCDTRFAKSCCRLSVGGGNLVREMVSASLMVGTPQSRGLVLPFSGIHPMYGNREMGAVLAGQGVDSRLTAFGMRCEEADNDLLD
jgi:hypothetical protein